MICEKCFTKLINSVCQSLTCVLNRQAEAHRAAERGKCGKSGVNDFDERLPSHEAPLDNMIYSDDPRKNKKCRHDNPKGVSDEVESD